MTVSVENLVRSGVVLAVGLPLTLGAAISLNNRPELPEPTIAEQAVGDFKDELTAPCLRYAFSGSDTKAEREAKNTIDEVVGEGANYGQVCSYVLG